MHNSRIENSYRCIGSIWDSNMEKMETEKIITQFQLDFQFRFQPGTLVVYQRSVKQFLSFTEKSFDSITKGDIRNWLIHLTENGYKPSTTRNKLISLKTFYKYCWEEELIEVNPAKAIPLPERDESIPQYLTRDQLFQLRRLVEGNLVERALIETLYATGIRISELAAMKKEDIHWSERTITIPSGKGKKGRIVLFTPTCAEYVISYLENRTDELPDVFANPMGNRHIGIDWVNRKFQSYAKQLGFHVTPHTLRHTLAAQLAQKGMPLEAIQKLLGHDDPHSTQLYTRLYDHARKEIYDELM